jgi:uncharacterized protein YutE (UPF0331/DUF86 family)
MTPDRISEKTVAAKAEIIAAMLAGMATLPLAAESDFRADNRLVAAGESYLRRGLEALLDLARHILAKGFGEAVPEYGALGPALERHGVVDAETAATIRLMARYRNRMVHFYDQVSEEELYQVLSGRRHEIGAALETMRRWLADNPGRVSKDL